MARPGRRIPPVTLYAGQEEIQTTFQKMSKAWICLHCGKEFSLLESMGQMQCDQHPGFLQEDGRWSCCGKRQFAARWSHNWPVQRMFSSRGPCQFELPYRQLPKVRGCQKCDHNTSDAPFTHKDAMAIGDLSALLPVINKEFPFHLRAGFDAGLLRRCATRSIVVPGNAVKVEYMDNMGETQNYVTGDGSAIPEGIELKAWDEDENRISSWH